VTGHPLHLNCGDRRWLRACGVFSGCLTRDLQRFRLVERQPRCEGNDPKTANAAATVRYGEVGLDPVELKHDLDNARAGNTGGGRQRYRGEHHPMTVKSGPVRDFSAPLAPRVTTGSRQMCRGKPN